MKRKTWNRQKRKALSWKDIIRDHIFVDFLHKRTLDEVIRRIKLYSPVLKKYKTHLTNRQKEFWKEYTSDRYEPDNRTGLQTYGYSSIESVEGTLNYLSDRFSAEARVQWLIDLPDNINNIPLTEPEEIN